ncbi:hypothetical protein BO71DRAFT_181139 [Aspergillus ellipticus CBS 707.79]|uniref:Uncharacterized protein n=1 Tax=Aspergillus ellipticus CBS 707.79 TaxID=1448320 RepID=A0A319DFZ1_9EURO|nr:hypothetical protein BO71DRAFT_181139 [Aspergillus ellipticus CBS 707.79]
MIESYAVQGGVWSEKKRIRFLGRCRIGRHGGVNFSIILFMIVVVVVVVVVTIAIVIVITLATYHCKQLPTLSLLRSRASLTAGLRQGQLSRPGVAALALSITTAGAFPWPHRRGLFLPHLSAAHGYFCSAVLLLASCIHLFTLLSFVVLQYICYTSYYSRFHSHSL